MINSSNLSKELVWSTDCKKAQARLKLQVHGNIQIKHIAVLLKASVQ